MCVHSSSRRLPVLPRPWPPVPNPSRDRRALGRRRGVPTVGKRAGRGRDRPHRRTLGRRHRPAETHAPCRREASIALDYTHDGTRLAVAGTDRSVRIWDLDGPDEPVVLSDPSEGLASVAFSPDGRMLATGGGDCPHIIQEPKGKVPPADGDGRTIRLWDPIAGTTIRSLRGHIGSIHGLAFSPDGTRLASAGADQCVRIWNVATGEVSFLLRGHSGRSSASHSAPMERSSSRPERIGRSAAGTWRPAV